MAGGAPDGHALLNALAYPAMGMMLVTLMLAYSRGALAALAIGLALWFCIVPLRLRGAAVLIVGGLGAGAVVAWDFSRHALTPKTSPSAQRATAGPPARGAAGRDGAPAHARGDRDRLLHRPAGALARCAHVARAPPCWR